MAQKLGQASQHAHNLLHHSFRHSTSQLPCHPSLIRSVLIAFSSGIVYLGSSLFYMNSIIFLKDFLIKNLKNNSFGEMKSLSSLENVCEIFTVNPSLIFIPNQSNYIVNLSELRYKNITEDKLFVSN